MADQGSVYSPRRTVHVANAATSNERTEKGDGEGRAVLVVRKKCSNLSSNRRPRGDITTPTNLSCECSHVAASLYFHCSKISTSATKIKILVLGNWGKIEEAYSTIMGRGYCF